MNTVISPVNVKERANLGIRAGDTVRVHQKIKEGQKTRVQVFEGLVIAVRHGKEAGATFTVRKVANGIGVERIYPLYSPVIEKVEITRRSKVRRAKLFYIRDKAASSVRRQLSKLRRFVPGAVVEDEPVTEDEVLLETEDADTTTDVVADEAPATEEVVEAEDGTPAEEEAPAKAE
jgi:large subunit ribosomal protein L19